MLIEVPEPAITSLDLRLGAVSVGATRGGPGWAAASTVAVLERLPTIRADRSGEPIRPAVPWGTVTVTDGDGAPSGPSSSSRSGPTGSRRANGPPFRSSSRWTGSEAAGQPTGPSTSAVGCVGRLGLVAPKGAGRPRPLRPHWRTQPSDLAPVRCARQRDQQPSAATRVSATSARRPPPRGRSRGPRAP